MDPNILVLEISSDDDADDSRGDCNWFTELFGKGDDDDSDCVVLDKDPNAPLELKSHNSAKAPTDDEEDILVVSEKGQVACRDYPHSRHLCIKFPFSSTPNQSHCNQCYCYVCDSLAPCVYWGKGALRTDHCHATDKDEYWKLERRNAKNGCKIGQPVTQPPQVDLQAPAQALVQLRNQIPNPGLIQSYGILANSEYPSIPSQYGNNVLTSRTKVHQGLTSQVLRAHRKYNLSSMLQRPVFKRTGSVSVATTANQNPYGSYSGNFGNIDSQQNYQGNGLLSGSSYSLGSLQPNAVKTSLHNSPQSQTDASSTVNPQLSLPRLQNPNFKSRVYSNPFPETTTYPQLHKVPAMPFRSQTTSSQANYSVPAQASYLDLPKTRVDSPVVPSSIFTQNISQGKQAQGSIVDSSYKDCRWDLPASQDSATAGFAESTDTTLATISGSLADHKYDWWFDDQPNEPGFTDYSSDSAFIDTGPVFDFSGL